MPEAVSIVGGGVVGLSTGVWLERVGYDTRIYTAQRTDGLSPQHAPSTVSTPYAAASIIPHRDDVPDAETVLATSNEAFARLAEDPDWPVRQQRHVMVFEGERGGRPSYAGQMPSFRPLDPDRDPVPTRDGVAVADVDGWSLDPYFVSMPQYVRKLADSYLADGGDVEERQVTRELLGELPGEVVVNATGLGATAFVEDTALHPVKGHMLVADGATGLSWDGAPASYNYYVPRKAAEPAIHYGYPREGELVLGGSKLPGELVDGDWRGPDDPGPTTTVDGVELPARILDVNEQLLGRTLQRERLTAAVGYRPGREGGARIEWDDVDGTPVIHNYGHGGAGVTYSWGSAALVERILEDEVAPADGERTPNEGERTPGDGERIPIEERFGSADSRNI